MNVIISILDYIKIKSSAHPKKTKTKNQNTCE